MACCQHLFLGYGTGYAWNEQGELAYYLKRGEKKYRTGIERTKESVLGLDYSSDYYKKDSYRKMESFNKGEHACFQPCGTSVLISPHSVAEISPLVVVLKDEVKPNEDWKQAMLSFCFALDRINKAHFKLFIKNYYKISCYGMWKFYSDSAISDFEKQYDIAQKLLEKWVPNRLSNAEVKKVIKKMVKDKKKELGKA